MTFFGVQEAIAAQLVRTVAGAELDRAALEERFARAAWTGIAEPGDGAAGVLVGALGPSRALTALIDRVPPEQLGVEVSDTGGQLDTADLTEAVARWQPRLKSALALLALRQAGRYGMRLLIPGDPAWPDGLADLGPHGPLALWVRGDVSALDRLARSISLVGARAATGYGEHVAMEASAGLVDRGFAIVSGAAYGIDGMAHRAALASAGTTIAVLAGGLDRFYPSGHEALLTRIVASGLVVSEVPPGTPPTKWRFLQRNRLIAAVSCATVVLEAGWRSGSLNTAGHAAALGRPLGAVPGPVTSAASAGCHRLIREYDAVLVTNAAEMAELAGEPAPEPGGDPASRSAEDTRVLDALSERTPRAVDDIAQRSGLSLATVQSVLGALELDGAASLRERGWVRTT
ncbi:DNA-processing protein DprA [Lysobacter korlensis]|uniref:DNA-processing protein DprA n=1 Tax=Lysobacter korlensis TaxID=553636 RepID=A0ABV6RRN9_9GAMM